MIFGFLKPSLIGEKAHEISGDKWFNLVAMPAAMKERAKAGKPIRLPQDVSDQVVLVDFWDYTCVNCVRTFPYLREWWKRYQQHGLLIIGVHTPEFEFGRDPENVGNAVLRYNLNYPVVSDSEYATWHRYHNNVWPREILVDHTGIVRHDHRGEGGYQITEQKIQELLKKLKPDVTFSDPLPAVHGRDEPGAVCIPVTSEIYLGTERGLPSDEMPPALNHWSFGEGWQQKADEIWHVGGSGEAANSPLAVHYGAAEVFAIMRTRDQQPATVKITLDGEMVPEDIRGGDVSYINGQSVAIVKSDRLFELINGDKHGEHLLEIYSDSNQLVVHTFTFGSACD